MIYFNTSISNPFSRDSNFKNYFSITGKLSGNKYWEVGGCRDSTCLVGIELDTRWSGINHGGIHIELTLCGYCFSALIYDNRHWDYDTDDWEVHN